MSNIYYLEKYHGADIYIMREDLIPFSFGGNKARIAQELFADLEERGCGAVISYGSPSSNMNRVIAHMAAARGIPCHVVMKREPGGTDRPMPFNERFVKESGALVTECAPDRVRETLEAVIREAEARGEKPYYIYGDSSGHGNEEVLMRAYGKQYWPIREFMQQEGADFRHIFLPVGTGATISGLAAGISEGCEVEPPHVKIHGISIARRAPAAKEDFRRFLKSCGYDTETAFSITDITDAYIGGGYGAGMIGAGAECADGTEAASADPVRALIREMLCRHGLPLDPVYTGKAYYGMRREIERLGISGDVIFIHTGGIPGFYDAMAGQEERH